MEDCLMYPAYDQYSARLSVAGDIGVLLGSGVLLVKKGQAMLLTCVHVLDNSGEAASFQAVFFSDPDREVISFRKDEYLLKGERGSSIGQDYILYKVPWRRWMSQLSDTRLAEPKAGMALNGFGFPEKYNKKCSAEEPLKGGTTLPCHIKSTVPNANWNYFYCELDNHTTEATDNKLIGFSGTGLFNADQHLVGIVKGRDVDRINRDILEAPEYDPEFLAISMNCLTQNFSAQNVRLWEETAMVRCLFGPFSRQGMHMGTGFLSLWSVLLTLRVPLVLFLFGGSDDLKGALEKINLLSPYWKNLSLEGFGENDSQTGTVYSTSYKEGFARVRQKLRSRKRASERGPVLIHVDITSDIVSRLLGTPDSIEFFNCVKEMGGCLDTDYVFLSEDSIEDSLGQPEAPLTVDAMSQREMINWFWEHSDSAKLSFGEFDDEACEIYGCVNDVKQWLKDKNWASLSDFLVNWDSNALYLGKVIAWLNDGELDAYRSLMTSLSERETNSVCRWLLLLCCRWSVTLLRDMSEDSADFQLLASLWEEPEHVRDATLAQIAATLRHVALT